MPSVKTERNYTGLEIAIIGISCHLPGADNWREYWDNLVNGVESIQFLSEEDLKSLGEEQITMSRQPGFVRARAVIRDKDLFDFSFFDYSPGEAKFLNPVHRVFHQCVWEAMEDAGYAPDQVNGPIGLYAGSGEDLNWKVYSMLKNDGLDVDGFMLNLINNKDYLASLVSYKLNLKGPAVSINTACSTSLVAVSLACKSLLLGEVKMALAGGITLVTSSQAGYLHQEDRIYSPDGHCRAFDKRAGGTVGSEGGGVVVLKRLTEAIKDGDNIYSIIKGSAINNDGNRKVGFAAPSVEGQVDCIRKARLFAKVEAATIGYIEAHGTGTRLGDPIEVEALNIAFNNDIGHRCAIGSVKTNIGHADAAAGVAGLIKAALSLKYKLLPPSLHFTDPNPEINFAAGPLYVNVELQSWERKGESALRAGVSSFGIGGTNAHAILEEPPEQETTVPGHRYNLLLLSAKTPDALLRYMDKLKAFLQREPDVSPADMAYTLQAGRRHFGFRKSVVYDDIADLSRLLEEGKIREQIIRTPDKTGQIVFLFPGQGSQYAGMGKGLYLYEPVFREEMDKGFAFLQRETGEDFRQVLYPEAPPGDPVYDKINETQYSQPLIFLVEYSLARLLFSIGIVPHCMIGHSIGEYVAACLSGVFSPEDALRLVLQRGALMSSLPRGSMVSIAATAEVAKDWVSAGISIAAINSPGQIVLSGDHALIEALLLRLDEKEIAYVRLHTSHAFHSSMQDSILEAFGQTLQKVQFSDKLQYPFISNRTGSWIRAEEAASPAYWVRHLRETVLFSEGIRTLLTGAKDLIGIEVGAGHSLSGLLRQHTSGKTGQVCINLLRSIREKEEDEKYFTGRLGQLWELGAGPEWKKYYGAEKRKRVSLPTYSFEPVRYRAEVSPFEEGLISGSGRVGRELKDRIYYPGWRRSVLQDISAGQTRKKRYLFFSPDKVWCRELEKQWLQKGEQVATVSMGGEFKRLVKGSYTISPTEESHIGRLLDGLYHDDFLITDIIYAWGIKAEDQLEWTEAMKGSELVFFCLQRIIRELSRKKALEGRQVIVITDSLHQVLGTEKGPCAQSLQLGFVNALPQEFHVTCYNIDIDGFEGLEGSLAAEIRNNNGRRDRMVAFRYGQRWVRDYQKNDQPLLSAGGLLKKNGVYLVTGGLGDIGYGLARYLVQQYEASVILTGRDQLEEVEKGSSGALERWKDLQRLSQEVHYYPADVSEITSLQMMVEEAEGRLGKIDGIIHAAGTGDNVPGSIIDLSKKEAQDIWAPKAAGIENLYALFAKRAPDFVWIASDLATVLGRQGSGAISAANLYMEYFVSSRLKELRGWKCVGLDGAAPEKEIPVTGSGTEALGTSGIPALFEWSIEEEGSSMLLESARDLAAEIHQVYGVKKEAQPEEYPVPITARKDRSALSAGYADPATETEQNLKEIFEAFFGVDGIGVEDNFFELGGDSLKGMALLKRIKSEFGINLELRDFFGRQTIREIAAYIDEVTFLLQKRECATGKTLVI